jgi:hypothetical protein
VNPPRTALFALLAVVVVPGLSACSSEGGGTVHTGAAAVVGGQRISVATLDDQVTAFRDAAPAQGSTNPKTFGQDSPGVPSNVLQFLIESQVVQSAVDAQGLSVTATDAVGAEAPYLNQAGSKAALTQQFVTQVGLPPSDLDAFFRMSAGELKLLQAAGISPSSQQQASAALTKVLSAQAAKLGIQVNPRYGSWDVGSFGLTTEAQPWIKQG